MFANKTHIFIKAGSVIFLIFCFAIYGFYKSRVILEGPEIIIENPQNGQTVPGSYVEINGKAKNVSFLRLNGRQIFTDEYGNFQESLLLARGYNIIEVSAKDKFNRATIKQLHLVLK